MADPGFSRGGGREPSRGGVNTPNFPENCMKSKEFGRPGGACVPHAPPRSANELLNRVQVIVFLLPFSFICTASGWFGTLKLVKVFASLTVQLNSGIPAIVMYLIIKIIIIYFLLAGTISLQ